MLRGTRLGNKTQGHLWPDSLLVGYLLLQGESSVRIRIGPAYEKNSSELEVKRGVNSTPTLRHLKEPIISVAGNSCPEKSASCEQ